MTEQPPVLDLKAGEGLPLAALAEEAPLSSQNETGREPLRLHMPVDVRSVSLAVLALLATLVVLHWARQVFIPVLLGVLLSYALSPIVNWAERLRVPRFASAALILLSLLGGMGTTVYSLSDDARDLIETLPVAAQKLRQEIRERRRASSSALETVQKAAAQIEQAAQESGAGAASQQRGVTRVVIEKSRFNITDYLWSGTVGLLALMAQITLVIFLTFFLMVSGDLFRRKLIKVAGSTLSSKKITLHALHDITHQIQRYLQIQLFTSALVGVLTWVALLAIGLEHAAVWGVAAGVLNLIPYVGSLIITGSSALVGFLQFGTVEMALVVAGASLVIHTLVGNLLTPWLTSRAGRMNPVAVFIGLLAWGWLWGVWGLLLGIPVLMVVKTICDRIEDLKPVGEFLGD